MFFFLFFFFFSSRRRHTRCSRDWSSDVCSSDLEPKRLAGFELVPQRPVERERFVRAPQPLLRQRVFDRGSRHACGGAALRAGAVRSEEHTSELQSRLHLVCRLLLEKKKINTTEHQMSRDTQRRV